MSQRKTRGNPRHGRTTNVPSPAMDAPNPAISVPNPTTDNSNSATTIAPTPIVPTPGASTPIVTIPTVPAIAITLGNPNLAPDSVVVPAIEDFGRDRNLKTLLKILQPKAFTGEGTNVSKFLEEWIMTMDDYFALAEYNPIAQVIMGRAKLEGSVKLWWKIHCQT